MSIEAGQQVLHYRLIEQIGAGGMGVVWKAEDTRLRRCVALKFVSEPDATDAPSVDRHLREARAASALNHPHICSIHDIGEWEGRRFIVMELLEGESLGQRIDGRPMEVDSAVELAAQIADALAAAHEKGIIHRDIKTANLFVVGDRSATPQAKMLDFGLAKSTGGPAPDEATRTGLDQTAPGAVMGTVAYMSPEQALGKELDPRTDLFSLGVVLYEMLTGRRAFEGNTSAAVFDGILNRVPTAPVELNPAVPVELQRIVDKALEKDPDLRYQSAAELRADLKRLQRGPDSFESRPVAVRNPRKSRGVIAASAFLLITAATVVFWQASNDDPAPAVPPTESPASKGPSIAVLPFVNTSGAPDQDNFGLGLTEEITTELTRYPDLFVIASHSTVLYEGDTADIRQISEALGGVRYVLQGSVTTAGDSIRVTAEFSDARDGAQLWRESYTRDLTAGDVFSLQDELTRKVVNAIAGTYGALSRAELASARREPPASLDSYHCVLRTYDYLHNHSSAQHRVARDCLERAIEVEPEYAAAWAWLAYIYAEEHHHRFNARPESYDAMDRALERAEHAVRLDATSQTAQGALALVHWMRDEQERFAVVAERAIALNPNDALWLGLMGNGFCQIGNFDQGIPLVRRALEVNPSPPGWIYLPLYLDDYRNGRYEAALGEAQKIETEDYRTQVFRAAVYGQLGRVDEARREFADVHRHDPGLPDDLRRDMIERHHYAPELTDHILDGLRKAGLE